MMKTTSRNEIKHGTNQSDRVIVAVQVVILAATVVAVVSIVRLSQERRIFYLREAACYLTGVTAVV